MYYGKEKEVEAPDSRTEWSPKETIALLVWLDHALKHEEVDFKATVVAHLKSKFTLQQIERKLSSLWNSFASDPDDFASGTNLKWREDVYKRGSVSIGLSDRDKEDIAAAMDELETEYVRSHFEEVPARNYRLRSSSLLGSISTIRSSQRVTPLLETKGTPLRQWQHTSSVTPSTVKREIRDTEPNSAEQSTGRKRLRTYSKRNQSIARYHLKSPKTPPSNKENTARYRSNLDPRQFLMTAKKTPPTPWTSNKATIKSQYKALRL